MINEQIKKLQYDNLVANMSSKGDKAPSIDKIKLGKIEEINGNGTYDVLIFTSQGNFFDNLARNCAVYGGFDLQLDDAVLLFYLGYHPYIVPIGASGQTQGYGYGYSDPTIAITTSYLDYFSMISG